MIIPVKKRIQIFDTTLRDGEQAPGASLTPEQKIILAGKLADLGVDVMEPGFLYPVRGISLQWRRSPARFRA